MKKLRKLQIPLLLTLLLTAFWFWFGFVSTAHCAWSCGEITSFDKSAGWAASNQTWQTVYRIKLDCQSDGTDPSEFNLSTYLSTSVWNSIRGGSLYKIHTAPGTDAPDNDVTIAFDGDLGENWYSITTTSLTTQAQEWDGESKILWDIQIDIGDIGSSGDDILIYFTVVK